MNRRDEGGCCWSPQQGATARRERRSPVTPDPGLEPVQLAEYDLAWPALFERERDLIAAALGDIVAAIEGSDA